MGDEDKKVKKKKASTKKAEDAPAEAAPAPAAAPAAAKPAASSSTKKKAQRAGSNVFAMFSQNKIQEFKEAFQLIDSDKDGFISKNDLRATFDSLGRLCTDAELDSMVAEAPGPINFTMFLSIFGDRVTGTDDEDVIVNAFNLYDEGNGKCKDATLRKQLTTWGDRFSEAEVEEAFNEAPMDENGLIDLKKFAKILTGGAEEAEEGA